MATYQDFGEMIFQGLELQNSEVKILDSNIKSLECHSKLSSFQILGSKGTELHNKCGEINLDNIEVSELLKFGYE